MKMHGETINVTLFYGKYLAIFGDLIYEYYDIKFFFLKKGPQYLRS